MTDLLLWLHIGFAIFALGPVTAATVSTPRFIRARNVDVLRYLHRTTRAYAIAGVGVFLFGVLLGREYLGKPYLSVSMTLFIVAMVLLVIVERDQRAAIRILGGGAPARDTGTGTDTGTDADADSAPQDDQAAGDRGPAAAATGTAEAQTGRIAALSGVVSLIWLVILVLMVWGDPF
ncbi:hypothetical protein [Planomonospora venezuelensis]|uniref:DUF2269 family protein n=1 Tax=Planomonospora venezuelensis TaxID=1999 RepID=A0A841D2Y9_PLAVE|nr:hypothetical protein [Planomonospora venezuelensis]MBB5962758.1 hypothetical protein [Planomonospora venezuelensis]GIM99446.1 hypothetical protein Pve01_11050 [Planomonospora venezuelensis]